jgi:hypothetical protein
MIALISPEAAQSAAIAWIGVLSAIAIAAAAAISMILPKVSALVEAVKTLKAGHERNATAITQIALATPPAQNAPSSSAKSTGN